MKEKEAQEALARAHARDVKQRERERTMEGAFVRKGTVALAAGVYGAMDLYEVPKTVKGFPWKIAVWFVTTLTEAMTRGAVQQTAGGLSDSTLALYLHDAVANKTIIAGHGGRDI